MKFSEKIEQTLNPDKNLENELEDNRKAITNVAQSTKENQENITRLEDQLEHLEVAIKQTAARQTSDIHKDDLDVEELVTIVTERVKSRLDTDESVNTPTPSREETGGKTTNSETSETAEALEELTHLQREILAELQPDRYQSSTAIAEKIDSTPDTVKSYYSALHGHDLIEAAHARGIKLSEKGLEIKKQLPEVDEDELEEATKEDEEESTVEKLYQHLGHDWKTRQDLAKETGIPESNIRNAYADLKKREDVKIVRGLGARKLKEGEHDPGTGRATGTGKRLEKVKEILKESERPLTNKEIGQELYDMETVESSSTAYNKVFTATTKLKDAGEIVDRSHKRIGIDGKSKAWEVVEGESEEEQEENRQFEEAKNNARVSDRDADIASLAMEKLFNRKEKETVSYHDFEQHYQGDFTSPLRMFQKLFENPELMKGIMKQAGVEKDYTWNKKSDYSQGIKNWRIELK